MLLHLNDDISPTIIRGDGLLLPYRHVMDASPSYCFLFFCSILVPLHTCLLFLTLQSSGALVFSSSIAVVLHIGTGSLILFQSHSSPYLSFPSFPAVILRDCVPTFSFSCLQWSSYCLLFLVSSPQCVHRACSDRSSTPSCQARLNHV